MSTHNADKSTWTVLDMFSGIGAFSLGLEKTGRYRPIAFCENDPFCERVLAKHWPHVPNIGDVRRADFPKVDAITGGFPCQDVSRAGGRAGLTGANSGLFWELVRAIRLVRPKIALLENVAALLDDGMGTVLGEMAEGWFDAEWDCVPAQAVGACHERDRIWIVAHPAESGDEGGCGSGGQTSIEWHESGWRSETSVSPDPESERRGQGRPRRPFDSFAWVRDEARRNAADPYSARLAFRQGIGTHAWEEFEAAQRSRGENVGQSIWPDESPLQGMDDEAPDWMDRVKSTGNTLDWYIPYLIAGCAWEQAHAE